MNDIGKSLKMAILQANKEDVPDGWFAVRDLAASLKCSQSWARTIVAKGITNELIEFAGKIARDCIVPGTQTLVPHYKLTRKGKRSAEKATGI